MVVEIISMGSGGGDSAADDIVCLMNRNVMNSRIGGMARRKRM